MRLAHSVKISVFCKEDDNSEQLKTGLVSLVPFQLEQEKLKVEQTILKGERSFEQDITILEINLTKERHITLFFKFLFDKLGAQQRQLLLNQASSRFDDDLNFYIRLDKDRVLQNEFELTESGECFHVKISIAAYPKRYDTALGVLKQILS